MDSKTIKAITRTLKFHAKALNIPEGSAEVFIKKSLDEAAKSLPKTTRLTEQDIIRIVAKKLRKYNSDLAYVYENYDRII